MALAAAALAGCRSPAGTGGSQSSLDPLVAELRADPERDLRGLVVVVDGNVVREEYFNGSSAEELHDIRSAGKSITSLLVGLAIERGRIPGVDARLPALLGAAAEPHARLSLADVLTMRSGLAADDTDAASPGNEDRLDASDDWLAFALAVPARTAPGQTYVYNSLTAFLAGAVVERAIGEPLADFAARELFAPLGIRAHRWRRGPRGEGAGQGNLSLRLRDLAAIGEMVRGGGVYHGRRVISEAWIAASLAPQVAIGDVDRYADHYGYMWYRKTYFMDGEDVLVHFASGNGGNKIYVVPSRRMVVAITSAAYGRPHGQRRSERILLSVLGALRQAPAVRWFGSRAGSGYLAQPDGAVPTPAIREQPGPGGLDRQRLVTRRARERCRLAVPAVEGDAARVRIDLGAALRSTGEILAVAAPVVQHVGEAMARLTRGADDLGVVAGEEDLAAARDR